MGEASDKYLRPAGFLPNRSVRRLEGPIYMSVNTGCSPDCDVARLAYCRDDMHPFISGNKEDRSYGGNIDDNSLR